MAQKNRFHNSQSSGTGFGEKPESFLRVSKEKTREMQQIVTSSKTTIVTTIVVKQEFVRIMDAKKNRISFSSIITIVSVIVTLFSIYVTLN